MNESYQKVVIFGSSGHAKVVIDILQKNKSFEIIGLIDSFVSKGNKTLGIPVLGDEDYLPALCTEYPTLKGIIAIGDNWVRKTMYDKIISRCPNFEFVSAIHPTATIGAGVVIKDGSVLTAHAIVNADARIGRFCILNTKSSLGHESTMRDFSSLAPGVTIGGNVSIGAYSAISLGVNVIQNITIGQHTVIGAGALVVTDIRKNRMAYGVPATEVRKRQIGEEYLFINMGNYKLKYYPLESEDQIKAYKETVDKVDPNHPFYRYESLYNFYPEENQKGYFVLKRDKVPLIVMPVFVRPIYSEGEKTKYKDVVSPYSYSGPLIKDSISNKYIKQFWTLVDQWYAENNVVTEFVRFGLVSNYRHYSGALNSTLENVKGSLKPIDIVWEGFKSKVRNNVRKAENGNLTYQLYQTEQITSEIIQQFHSIYDSTMHRNKAAEYYFYPLAYFIDFIRANPKHCAIAMVYKEGIPISTELILRSQDTLYSFLGGTLSDYFELRPNDFLKYHTIRWGINNSYSFYVLGGGRSNNDGLYSYKKAFFPKDADVTYYTGRKIILPDVYEKLNQAAEIQQKIKDCKSTADALSYFPLYRLS